MTKTQHHTLNGRIINFLYPQSVCTKEGRPSDTCLVRPEPRTWQAFSQSRRTQEATLVPIHHSYSRSDDKFVKSMYQIENLAPENIPDSPFFLSIFRCWIVEDPRFYLPIKSWRVLVVRFIKLYEIFERPYTYVNIRRIKLWCTNESWISVWFSNLVEVHNINSFWVGTVCTKSNNSPRL